MEKRWVIFVALLLLSGCTSLNEYKGKYFSTQAFSGYSGRGVTVEFLQNQPPSPIQGEFSIGLLFKNFKDAPMNVDYTLWDESNTPLFSPPQTGALLLDAADVDVNSGTIQKFGYNVITLPNLIYKDFTLGDRVQFTVALSYDVSAENYLDFCIETPQIQGLPTDREGGCIGDRVSNNQHDPVYIASFQKQVTRMDQEGRDVNMDMTLDIKNDGSGKAYRFGEEGKEVIHFSYQNEGSPVDLLCLPAEENKVQQDTQYRKSFNFLLKQGRVTLHCKSRFSLDSRFSTFKVKIILDYPYTYKTSIGPIDLKG